MTTDGETLRFFAVLRRNSCWAVFFVAVIYGVIAWFVRNNPLLVFLRAVEMTVGASVLIGLWWALRSVWAEGYRRVQPDHIYTLGTVLLWLGVTGNAAWLFVWRVSDEPVWMVNSAINGFFVVLICIGGILQMVAPWAEEGAFPMIAIRRVLISAAIVCVLFSLAYVFHDKMREFTVFVRPYLGEVPPFDDPRFLRDESKVPW
jgi:hypothetical protein